jgi:hypothetical protein
MVVANSSSNNHGFCQKHLDVPDGYDGSDGTLYPLMENYTLSVVYLSLVLYAQTVVTYIHRQNDMCVTLFAGAAVIW